MSNAYLTPYDYRRAATGQETDSLVGNLTRLSAGVSVGATALPLTDTTVVALNVYDDLTIFDGTSTEVVQVAAIAPVGSSSVTVSTTQFAHAKGTVVCSDGAFGSLSDKILTASDMIEDITYQQLLLSSHTDTLPLQTMRASISNVGALLVRTLNFPIQSVSSIVITVPGGTAITLDSTLAFLDSGGQLVRLDQLIPTASVPLGSPFQTMLGQRTMGNVTVTYTSGYAWGSLPPRIRNAGILLCSDQLAHRNNSDGAFLTVEGKVRKQYAPPTDTSGQSLLYKQACDNLSSWTVEPV